MELKLIYAQIRVKNALAGEVQTGRFAGRRAKTGV